jgi:hypothetical protein
MSFEFNQNIMIEEDIEDAAVIFVNGLLSDHTQYNWNAPEQIRSYYRWTNNDNNFVIYFKTAQPDHLEVFYKRDSVDPVKGQRLYIGDLTGQSYQTIIDYALGL